MTQQEKDEKVREYKEKAIALLGHHMQVFECRWYGGHPVVQIAYNDYKVSIITRAELQQLMPEVEFASVIREFSTAAMLSELPHAPSDTTRKKRNAAFSLWQNGAHDSIFPLTVSKRQPTPPPGEKGWVTDSPF